MKEQKRSLKGPIKNAADALRRSFQARILLIAVSGAVVGIVLTAIISVVGINSLAGDASHQIEASLGATTHQDLGNRIEATSALVNASMDHPQADLRILADITQKLIDHREEFRPLTEAATQIPFFEDKMAYHPGGRYSQNTSDEPTVVTVQTFLHEESFQLKPYPEQMDVSLGSVAAGPGLCPGAAIRRHIYPAGHRQRHRHDDPDLWPPAVEPGADGV